MVNNVTLLEVSILTIMRLDVGFVQTSLMNGIQFKIVCRCSGKNVLKDLDDDSETSFGSL